MGSLNIYTVSFDALRSARGSQDASLVKDLGSRVSAEVGKAVEELVLAAPGAYVSDKSALAFGEEALCGWLGQRLPCNSVSGTSLSRLETLDEALEKLGAPLKLFDLMYGGGALGLPWPDDFPSSGTRSAEQVAEAHRLFGAADLQSEDPAVDDILAEMGDWLEMAAAKQWGLIGFYY
jgi:hypothetical protein